MIYRFENEGSKASLIFLKKLETILTKKISNFDGYKKSDLVGRWAQLFVEDNLSLMKKTLPAHRENQPFITPKSTINLKEGSVRLPFKVWLNNLFVFNSYLITFYLLFIKSFLLNFFKSVPKLRYQVFDNYDLEKTLKSELEKPKNFFNQGPISLFNDKDPVIVGTNYEPWVCKNFTAAKKPWITILNNTKFSISELIKFKIFFLFYFLNTNWLFLIKPLMSVFSKDFAFHWLVSILNEKKMITDYIITNSYLLSHRLCFTRLPNKNFTSHMVWYSVNSRPYIFKAIKDEEIFAPPLFRYVSVNHHWVWNNDQASWIKEVCAYEHKATVVGPIMFHLPSDKPVTKLQNKVVVTIFDVTPMEEDHLKDQQGLHGYNYYNAKNCLDFLSQTIDILREHFGVRLILRIKPKRAYKEFHDKNYIECIKTHEKKGELMVLEATNNIFDVIKESDLVVSIPFSSPSLIAQFYQIPSVLFDPSENLINNYSDMEALIYVSGRSEFKKMLASRF